MASDAAPHEDTPELWLTPREDGTVARVVLDGERETRAGSRPGRALRHRDLPFVLVAALQEGDDLARIAHTRALSVRLLAPADGLLADVSGVVALGRTAELIGVLTSIGRALGLEFTRVSVDEGALVFSLDDVTLDGDRALLFRAAAELVADARGVAIAGVDVVIGKAGARAERVLVDGARVRVGA